MKSYRLAICTLVLAVFLAAIVNPAFKDLAAQLPQSMPSVVKWLSIAFLYVVQGASALSAARRASRWIFAYAN